METLKPKVPSQRCVEQGDRAFSAFRRASLSDQAAALLRESIQRGALGEVLPGEHELARRLGISRPSVRAAITVLSRDGFVTVRKGRRSLITPPYRRRPPGALPAVCVIVPASRDLPDLNEHPLLLELHAAFADQGIGWEEVFDARLAGKRPARILKRLVAGRRNVCWLLVSTTAAIQGWFQQAGQPALIVGSCFPGVKLPSVDIDYRAIGWHAAGRMAQAGHRHIAIVLSSSPMPGDIACRDGFLSYAQGSADGLSTTEISPGPDSVTFRRRLERLLARNPRPTALLIMKPKQALAALIHLLRLGVRVPGEMSLISSGTYNLLDEAVPELTRYQSGLVKQARRIVRVARSLFAGRKVPPKSSLIMPAYVAGETLAGPAPAGR